VREDTPRADNSVRRRGKKAAAAAAAGRSWTKRGGKKDTKSMGGEGGVAKKDARENATRVADPPLRRKWRNFPAAAVCYSFLSLPWREIRCIIHDFVNVACRCIFTVLYLEKFTAPWKLDRDARVHAASWRTAGHAVSSTSVAVRMMQRADIEFDTEQIEESRNERLRGPVRLMAEIYLESITKNKYVIRMQVPSDIRCGATRAFSERARRMRFNIVCARQVLFERNKHNDLTNIRPRDSLIEFKLPHSDPEKVLSRMHNK